MSVGIVVVGSLNMDLVTVARRRPGKGETVTGTLFGTYVGGKGCNQAIAGARLGAHTAMVGRLGVDHFGDQLLAALRCDGVDTTHVVRDAEVGTGVASILVEEDGDNSIIVVPMANGRVSIRDVEAAIPMIERASVLMLQLEIPLEACMFAARAARRAGVCVLLNPAPARQIPDTLIELTDLIIPNEFEATILTGVDATRRPEAAAAALVQRGAQAAIVTLGGRGAVVAREDVAWSAPAFAVDVVDTTAAGDAFCAGVAVATAEGRTLRDAVRFGSAAGAMACTQTGAEPSLPHRASVEQKLD